jgi:beta-ketoacyl-acyl-carrier-protein synthase II
MIEEKIVITGMGTVNPLGLSVKESWENALNGVSGVGPITLFDSSRVGVHIASEVKNFKPEDYMEPKEARRRDRYQQIASAAAKEAITQAGLSVDEEARGRIGVVMSSAVGGIGTMADMFFTLHNHGPRRLSPFSIPMLMSNGAAGLISIDYGFRGPSLSVASACASGIDAIGTAWTMLRAGMIDAAIAGASEASITEVGVGAFDRVGAMSRRQDYATTPQPFDLNRDGLVMGEGAAALVLERESHARQRGAEIFAELAGYCATADAFHITAPAEDGSGGARAIRQAMASAGVSPEQVGYINAHGTGTELNDVSETKAIKSALGQQAYQTPVSSTKSMTGHMMGATGALETIFCVRAIQTGLLPPTIHYQTPDPRCDLDYIPNQARERKIEVALNNAFGFGGHNAVLVVRAYR